MGVHRRIPDEGLKASVWWVGVSYKDRPTSKDVTTVAKLPRQPQDGMEIRIRGTRVRLSRVRAVVSDRFDVIAQVVPVNG